MSQSYAAPAGLQWKVRCLHGLPALEAWKRRCDREKQCPAVAGAVVVVVVDAPVVTLGWQTGWDHNSGHWQDGAEMGCCSAWV